MNRSTILILLIVGATAAAPLNVLYALAPVPLKQTTAENSKAVVKLPADATLFVLKFDKPIIAEVSKSVGFKDPEVKGESSILKLETADGKPLTAPSVIEVKDTKSGDAVKILVLAEGMKKTE